MSAFVDDEAEGEETDRPVRKRLRRVEVAEQDWQERTSTPEPEEGEIRDSKEEEEDVKEEPVPVAVQQTMDQYLRPVPRAAVVAPDEALVPRPLELKRDAIPAVDNDAMLMGAFRKRLMKFHMAARTRVEKKRKKGGVEVTYNYDKTFENSDEIADMFVQVLREEVSDQRAWRNWSAHPVSNREVGGSSPPVLAPFFAFSGQDSQPTVAEAVRHLHLE